MSVRAAVPWIVALLIAGAVGAGVTLLVRGAGSGAEALPDPVSAARTAFPGPLRTISRGRWPRLP